MSTLCKKVFSGAPVKCAFLYESNNLNSVVFENDGFAEIKDHSLRTTPFKKKIINGSLGFVSTLCKKVFSGVPVKGTVMQIEKASTNDRLRVSKES